jgi:hypothetical protein
VAVVKEELPDARTEMALVCIKVGLSVAQLDSLAEQPGGTAIEDRLNELALRRLKLSPNLIERPLVHVPDYDAAARAAKHVAEWVNVDAFGGEKIRLAVVSIPGGSLKRSLGMVSHGLAIPKACGFEAATGCRSNPRFCGGDVIPRKAGIISAKTRKHRGGDLLSQPPGCATREAAGVVFHRTEILPLSLDG